MLLDYSFKNFCSFKGETEFSMRVTKEDIRKNFPDNYVHGKINVLKSAIIIGENAGGKSNFIKSLKYLQSFFKENRQIKSKSEYINDDYNPLRVCDTLQSFTLSVLIDEVIYDYKLNIDHFGVKYEHLKVNKQTDSKSTPIFIIERTDSGFDEQDYVKNLYKNTNDDVPFFKFNFEIKLNPSYKQFTDFLSKPVVNNDAIGLYISKIALLNVSEAVALSNWVNNTLSFEFAPYSGYESSSEQQQASEILKIIHDERFLEILQIIDSSITEIKPDQRLPYQNTLVVRKNDEGTLFQRELSADSTGLRDYFRWAIQIFKVIYENKVLFADEMDRSLNPVLADKIVALIHGSEHKGQFIFTTHNVLHLNLNKQMKEQIYFVTKDLLTLHSELYSLSDFPEIDYNLEIDLYKFYLRGILGGTIRG